MPMREQTEWDAHAAFMDAMESDGFLLAGGPLGTEDGAKRVLHVVATSSADAVYARLAQDPWTATRLLDTVSVEPWTVLLGGFGARG